MVEALRSVGEAELLDELLEQMARTWRDGAARVARAMELGGPEKAAAVAHALWGVAATLGAIRVRDCAARVEKCLQSSSHDELDGELGALDEALGRFVTAVGAAVAARAGR